MLGTIAAGERTEEDLPVGEHVLEIADEGGETSLGQTEFVIEAGATTTIRASALLGRDDDEISTPRPQTVTTSRVDTGAGGATTDGARELVLGGLAAAAAVGALTLGLRRRTTA